MTCVQSAIEVTEELKHKITKHWITKLWNSDLISKLELTLALLKMIDSDYTDLESKLEARIQVLEQKIQELEKNIQ